LIIFKKYIGQEVIGRLLMVRHLDELVNFLKKEYNTLLITRFLVDPFIALLSFIKEGYTLYFK